MTLNEIVSKPQVIFDTCIMIDIIVASRPRHSAACRLSKELKSRGIVIIMPMHGYFEMISATKHEVRKSARLDMFNSAERESERLDFCLVDIDKEFVIKYSATDLPIGMGAADGIFTAMAKIDQMDLVTEDIKHYQHAKNYGVSVYKINEYLEKLNA